MSRRLADVTARIEGIAQLGAVVNAMRGIASARAQAARSALAAVDSYAATVGQAISRALADAPQPSRALQRLSARRALVLFVAEQGFAGAFSERVFEAAGDLDDSLVYLVGARGGALAAERGLALRWQSAAPAQPQGVARLADRLLAAVETAVAAGEVDRVAVVFSVWRPGEGVQVMRRRLFPFDLTAFAPPAYAAAPLMNLPPDALIRDLAFDFLHAQLCDAALNAFAAENEARVETMAAARREIDRQLGELRATQRLVRQEEITAEIIELAAGETASRANRRRGRGERPADAP
jgi:F-type H+-transporting ATPase subunit gamma